MKARTSLDALALLLGLSAALATSACGSPPDEGPAGATGSTSSTGAGAGAGGGDAGALAQLPVRIDYLKGDDIRFATKVTVGKTEIEALVDTGSSGLRILPGLLSDSDLASTSTTRTQVSFGGSLMVSGTVATASVTLAGLTTPQPIPVQIIDKVSCTVDAPNCDAAGQTAATYRFHAAQGGNYRAIMGIGMSNTIARADVANPIVQLAGHPGYVLDMGEYGSTSATLTIGPTAAQNKQFKTIMLPPLADGKPLADGSPAYDDKSNNVCILDKTQMTSYCAPTSFDTGGGATHVNWAPHQGAPTTLPAGDDIDIQVHASAEPASAVIAEDTFRVSATPKTGVDKVIIFPSSTSSQGNTGPLIFFRYRMLFDQAHGLLGLAPR